MVNAVRVYADHGRDFNPLADPMTKLRHFTKVEICEFSECLFSLELMFNYTLKNVCLTISQKLHTAVAQKS